MTRGERCSRPRRISAILRRFTHVGRPSPTVGELSSAFDTRAFGAFFIVFGGVNLIPLPPGGSFVFGIPLLLFTIQVALGRHRLWLPERVRGIRISTDTLRMLLSKLGPGLRRIERLAKPRYWPRPDWVTVPAVGWFAFLMALLVFIPVPGTNMGPGVSIALSGIAITARDGLWLAASLLVGVGSVCLLAGLYGTATLAVMHFL